MEIRVVDSQIIPVKWRLACQLEQLTRDELAPLAPFHTDTAAGAVLCHSDAERDIAVKFLEAAGIAATIVAEPQPDPTLLAALQGKLATRSAALAALAAGKPPVTVDSLALKLDKAAADIIILQSKVGATAK